MLNFRKANLSDIENLTKLRIDFMREVNGSLDHEDERKYEALFNTNMDYFRESISKGDFIAWLAIDNENIVGTSGLVFYNRPPSFKNLSGKVAYIMNIYTLESYRKQGIADKLLHKTIVEATTLGYNTIFLSATDMGKPLYQKHGFKDVSGEMVLNIKNNDYL